MALNGQAEPSPRSDAPALPIVLSCAPAVVRKVKYVFDTLLMAAGIPVVYVESPPRAGPWLLYAPAVHGADAGHGCVVVSHEPEAWSALAGERDIQGSTLVDGLAVVLPRAPSGRTVDVPFDLIANAFYFLASWSERKTAQTSGTRQLFAQSVYRRLGVPQDIVDRYLRRLVECLNAAAKQQGARGWATPIWPGGARYALVLSHDVDFLPRGTIDVLRQGGKTLLRHLIRQRDASAAFRAGAALARACLSGRDPYGCVPEIIARERDRGVRSSFQVAVGHRHPKDVEYRIEDDAVRDYLRSIPDAGFDLCLHGSYRSTEDPRWYAEEVELLAQRLGRPAGSRQHYLSFDYDALFSAQERSGIRYDMSIGYPDHTGPRAGFSYPYFPYCIEEDRRYDVVEIPLALMDVSLSGYMRLQPTAAWTVIEDALAGLATKGGCVSSVWHPIVFGGARDPGYDALYWRMVACVQDSGGLATDGRTVDAVWRARAAGYPSLASTSSPTARSPAMDAGRGAMLQPSA